MGEGEVECANCRWRCKRCHKAKKHAGSEYCADCRRPYRRKNCKSCSYNSVDCKCDEMGGDDCVCDKCASCRSIRKCERCRRPKEPAIKGSRYCRDHTCPKCNNEKSSRDAYCQGRTCKDDIKKGDTVQVRRSYKRHRGEVGVVTKMYTRGNCEVTVGNATFCINIDHLTKDFKIPGN